MHITGKKSQDNFSPEATLTWRPSRDVTLYGAYKTGFLAGAYSNPGVLAVSTALLSLDFKEETVKGFEIGLKTSLLDRRLTANVTGYRYIYKGLPLTSLIALNTNTLAFITQNAASTIAQGIEVETNYNAGGGTSLRATASYNDAKFRSFARAQCYTGQTVAQGCLADPLNGARFQDLSGRPVYRAPRWIATAGMGQTVELSNVTLNATVDLRYSSNFYAGLNLNPLTYQKGYLALNAGITATTAQGVSIALIGGTLPIGVMRPSPSTNRVARAKRSLSRASRGQSSSSSDINSEQMASRPAQPVRHLRLAEAGIEPSVGSVGASYDRFGPRNLNQRASGKPDAVQTFHPGPPL